MIKALLRYRSKTVSFYEAIAILDSWGERYLEMTLFSFGASSWLGRWPGRSHNWTLFWFKRQPHELKVKRWYGAKTFGRHHRIPRRLLP